MSKRILIFSTAYFPFVGGAEVAVKEITDRISGVEFDMITAKMKKGLPFKEKVGNVNVYRLGVGVPIIDKLLLPFDGAFFTNHLKKKNSYGAYWCVMSTYASGAAYISNMFSKVKVPIVLNLQEGDSEEYFSRKWFGLINLSWRLALKFSSHITVLSSSLKERALRFGYKGDLDVIPNAVDVGYFSKQIHASERIEIRDKWKVASEDIVLITTSRLNEKNGIADVIKSLPHLQNVVFVVCGDGELRGSLEKSARELGVERRVVFLGNISHADLPKYLQAADIFIRPSLSEGFGVSFVEAMAAKIPVIATPVGGIVDFVRDGETGYLCKPHDYLSIVDTVRRVINDENKGKVVNTAFEMVKEKYDWDRIAPKVLEVFDKIGKR